VPTSKHFRRQLNEVVVASATATAVAIAVAVAVDVAVAPAAFERLTFVGWLLKTAINLLQLPCAGYTTGWLALPVCQGMRSVELP